MKYDYRRVSEFLKQNKPTARKAQEHFGISRATWYRWLHKHAEDKGAGVEDLKAKIAALNEEIAVLREEHFAMVMLLSELGLKVDGEAVLFHQIPQAAIGHLEARRDASLSDVKEHE